MADAVRRKHIAQNRDIVRANTLAHLRIRELETRVLALVETIRNYLGPAQQREWTRWKTQYEDGSLYDLQDTVDPLTGEVTAHRRTDAYEQELYRIGDCVAPRKVDMAIWEGHRVGREI